MVKAALAREQGGFVGHAGFGMAEDAEGQDHCDGGKDDTPDGLADQDAGRAQPYGKQDDEGDGADRVAAPVDPGGIERVRQVVERGIGQRLRR